MQFDFNHDIRYAETIPSRCYTDPRMVEIESETIFGRCWQLVGRVADLQASGQFITADIAEESIVIVRDGDVLRGFHNICLHRAGPVAEGCGKRNTLQCKYHGWTYRLDGSLHRAPEMEGTEGFNPEAMRLKPVQVATWGPLVFANLDLNAPALLVTIDGIPERTARFNPAEMKYVMRKSWLIECNWKVYVDNYLEGYHLPAVHPGLFKELDYDAYRVEPHRYWSLQHAPMRQGHDPDRKYVATPESNEAQYYWIFPNMMLNIYLGQMQTNVVIPRGHDRCEVVFEWFAEHPPENVADDPNWTRLVAFSDEIQHEDIKICEQVQKNLRSTSYDRGRYSAKRENGVHHFHGLIHDAVSGGGEG